MKNGCFYFLFIVCLSANISYPQPFNEMLWFNIQDTTKTTYYSAQPLINNNEIVIFYSANRSPADTIYFVKSADLGISWSEPVFVSVLTRENDEIVFISALKTNTGRLLVVYTISETPVSNNTKFIYSDDNGSTWSLPQNIIGIAYVAFPKVLQTPDNRIWVVGRNNYFFLSTDNGSSWNPKNLGFGTSYFSAFDLLPIDNNNYLTTYDLYDSGSQVFKVYSRKSTDGGNTWGTETLLTEPDSSEKRPRLYKESNGTIWLITQKEEPTPFTIGYPLYQQNITYRKSTDNGITWSSRTRFTNYLGLDGYFNICEYSDKPLITFLSDRRYGKKQIWIGQIGTTLDDVDFPVLYHSESSNVAAGIPIDIRAYVGSLTDVQQVRISYNLDNTVYGPYQMYDDGNHNDYAANDNIWGLSIGPFNNYDIVKTFFQIIDINSTSAIFEGLSLNLPSNQIENRWLNVGSFHNWYSSIGGEREEGFEVRQQFGSQWPAIYSWQDMQCSKGLWLGSANFTDENLNYFPYKVVTAGPRDPLAFTLYPKEFMQIAKFPPTEVTVNGIPSFDKETIIDMLDNNLIWDRMIYNKVNTQLGVTIERRIAQLSQGFNNSYIINEYILSNTGNTDYDETIELPNNTIDSLYLFLTYRYAINASTRFVIGNSTGWGKNTMNDARGDGVLPDPVGEEFRAQFSWHGYTNERNVSYDNIGGPIWELNSNALNYNDSRDTTGRFGATQFVGILTLHADNSALDTSDNYSQPSTTTYTDSDGDLFLAGRDDGLNIPRMISQHNLMSSGHKSPRHAYLVEPSGDFALQRNDPNLGNGGGFQFNNGYGPYNLQFGENVRIVIVEAAGGLSRQKQIDVGHQYKYGWISDLAKDSIVIYQGRDSLFQTFRNAIEAYNADWNIPQPPRPPATFSVQSDSPKIILNWSFNSGDPNPPVKLRIYRSPYTYYDDTEMIAELEPNITHFEDTTIQAGIKYFYYISSVGQYQSGGPATPPGQLESSRYYTQTYDGVYIGSLTGIEVGDNFPTKFYLSQNYPNPFNPSTKIKYSIPQTCKVVIKVFDIIGKELEILVNEEKTAGNYEIEFTQSSMKNLQSSGVYFYQIRAGSFVETKKMILLK